MAEDRTPPNDERAELAVLGATMREGKIPDEADTVTKGDFYRPANAMIWDAILNLDGQSRPCDPVAVAAQLDVQRTPDGRSDLDRVGGAPYLHTCLTNAALGNTDWHVTILHDRTLRRRGYDAAAKIAGQFLNSKDDALTILDRAEASLGNIPARHIGDPDTLMNIDEFVSQDLPAEDWVIPGLLERGERFMLTGAEGGGKSTLSRQFAVCSAAGINPFTEMPMHPAKVLLVDAENPNRLMVRRFLTARDVVKRKAELDPNNLWIDRAPGLNLRDPAGRRWLNQRMAATHPDLLVIGPLYKLFVGDPKDEQICSELSVILDDFRERYQCSLMIEAHQAKGGSQSDPSTRTVEPIGSSLWLRWVDFGYGLRGMPDPKDTPEEQNRRRLCRFVAWKGPRDPERDWPYFLESGQSLASLPWVVTHPSNEPSGD